MKVVIDANIIISALIGSKKTVELITSGSFTILAPKKIINEVRKYKD